MINRYLESFIIEKNYSMLLQLRIIMLDLFFALPLSLAIYLSIKLGKVLVKAYYKLKDRFSDEKPKSISKLQTTTQRGTANPPKQN
jgi:hypothetical protein